MSKIHEAIFALLTLMVLIGGLGIARYALLGESGRKRDPMRLHNSSRRDFLGKASGVVVLIVVSSVLKPLAAFAGHLRCNHFGVSGSWRTCRGLCSQTYTRCCMWSPNGIYYDCCTGTCTGGGCKWSRAYRVNFSIDNSGGCYCFLQAC